MSTYSRTGDAAWDDRDEFGVAVRQVLRRHDFQEISRAPDGQRLWKHCEAKQTVLVVVRDRDHRVKAMHDPLEEAVLLVGGKSRSDRLFWLEDAIWCWYRQWGVAELRQKLDDRAKRANDCADGGKGDIAESIPFRELLSLSACDPSRSDLERRFSGEQIESTIRELSRARYEQLREQLRARLVRLPVPDASEGIPGGGLPPGVVEPYRPKELASIDFEALVSGREAIDEQAPIEVTIENGSCSEPETASDRVEAWLQEPNPVLGGRSPDDILGKGDRAECEYLFGLIAGIECAVHS